MDFTKVLQESSQVGACYSCHFSGATEAALTRLLLVKQCSKAAPKFHRSDLQLWLKQANENIGGGVLGLHRSPVQIAHTILNPLQQQHLEIPALHWTFHDQNQG